jgi:hypothetical protein
MLGGEPQVNQRECVHRQKLEVLERLLQSRSNPLA